MDPGTVPAEVKDKEDYDSWKNATARFRCKYVSDADSARPVPHPTSLRTPIPPPSVGCLTHPVAWLAGFTFGSGTW